MQNILLVAIMTLVALPVTVFSASGPVGSVETLSTSVLSSNVAADVRASVQTSIPPTTHYIEYGPTPEFGRNSPAKTVRLGDAKILTTRLSSLRPNVTYYYRAVLEGTAGTVYGETRSFTTNVRSDVAYAQGGSGTTLNPSTGSGNATNIGSGTISNNTQTGAVGNAISGTGNNTSNNSGNLNQSASPQNPGGFFQRLFDSVTRARPVQLSVATNPVKPKARDIIEYVVTYTNGSNAQIAPGTLKVVLPDSVVYLADNSGGRTTLSKVVGGQEITLPTQTLLAKEKRTMTIMAVAGSAVGSVSPTAIASMSYTNAQGSAQNITTNKAQSATTLVAAPAASIASVAQATETSNSGGILPNTFFEWLVFLAVVTTIIVVVRKVMATYQERKKRILEESREVSPAHA